MDEPESHWRKTTAGLIAVILLLTAAVIFTRCSTTSAAQIPQTTPEPEPIEWSGYDFHEQAARALVDLEVFLNSVTTTITTSTSVPKEPENFTSEAPVPEFRNDHTHRWDQLAHCETGGNWAANTGNGFGGGLQFAHTQRWSTWLSFGGGTYAPHPWDASREQQIDIAEQVLASSGWKAWPGCSRKNGWL
jgi:hypothetical protein